MILGRPAPPGRITIVHGDPDKAEAAARILRPAGHRVQIVGRAREEGVVEAVVASAPDLFIGSAAFAWPPLGQVVRGVRQVLGDVPVLVLMGEDAPDSLSFIEGDALIREPLLAGELELRVGGILRDRFEIRTSRKKIQELSGLAKIPWAFALEGGPETLCGHLAQQSAELLRARKGLVLLFDRERRRLVAQHKGHGLSRDQVARCQYLADDMRAAWNFATNGPLLSNRASADNRLSREQVELLGLVSVVIAPMTRGPRVLGLLLVGDRTDGTPFGEDDLSLLTTVAEEATVAVENLRLHEELKRANTLLQEYDRIKSEFVAIVAHDFRRPLTAIRGFAELLLEDPEIDVETRREYMTTVITETEGLARLADDTLLITRIESEGFDYQWSELDLGPFLLEAMPLGLSDHSVLVDIPPGFPHVVADPGRLRQVVTNLISNAIKYSPQGGAIAVRCRERGPQHVTIEVVDRGLGIPADQIPNLFAKFRRVRTDAHLAISGTGLGLYICRLIVEGHGGTVWVESELGKGSTFGLLLPKDARAARPGVAANQGATAPAADR